MASHGPVPSLFAALLTLTALLAMGTGGQGQSSSGQEGTPEGTIRHWFEGGTVELRNRTFNDLAIRNATRVVLENVTVEGRFDLVASESITVDVLRARHMEVQRSLGASLRALNVSGDLQLLSVQQFSVIKSVVGRSANIAWSSNVTLYWMWVAGGLCVQGSQVEESNVTAGYRGCPGPTTMATTSATTTAPAATTTATGGGGSTRTEPAPSFTTYTTTTYPPYPTSSAPTTAPPTTTAGPVDGNYVFELGGQTLHEDVVVTGASRVTIREAVIEGELHVVGSRNVVMADVRVSGQVVIRDTRLVDLVRVHVGGPMYLEAVSSFEVQESSVDGDLSCVRSSAGSLRAVQVGGRALFFGCDDVDTSGIEGGVLFPPLAPMIPAVPATPLTPTAPLQLNVADGNLEFYHPRTVGAAAAVDVRLAVSAAEASMRLRVASQQAGRADAMKIDGSFEKLIEYEDRDLNGAYDLGDHVVQEFVVEDLPMTALRQQRLGDGDDGWRGRIEYELPARGQLVFTFTARQGSADRTKIDVEIHDFPYGSPISQLALQARLVSASEWSIDDAPGHEDRLTFNGTGINGYFSWLDTADVDGRTTSVTARVLEEHKTRAGEREVVVLLGYQRGRHIVHDPEIGVLEASLLEAVGIRTLGDAVVYGTTLVAVLAFLVTIARTGGRPKPPKPRPTRRA